MKENSSSLIELTFEEQVNFNGGSAAWEFLGKVVRGFQCFMEGASEGGYAAAKCS